MASDMVDINSVLWKLKQGLQDCMCHCCKIMDKKLTSIINEVLPK